LGGSHPQLVLDDFFGADRTFSERLAGEIVFTELVPSADTSANKSVDMHSVKQRNARNTCSIKA